MAGLGASSFAVIAGTMAFGCGVHSASSTDKMAPRVARVDQPAVPAPTIAKPESRVAETGETETLHAAIAASLNPTVSEDPSDVPAVELEPIEALVRNDATEVAESNAELGPTTARLPPESVRRIVHQSAGRFRDCYVRALLRNLSSSGRVVVRFVIGPDGRVVRAEETSASLADREARRCVLQNFFDLSFPNPTNQKIVVFYPLSFSRDGSAPLDALPSARQIAEAPPPGFAQAMRSGRRVQPPAPAVTPHTPRLRPSSSSRCSDGDPLCSDF